MHYLMNYLMHYVIGQDGVFMPACLAHCMAHWQGPVTVRGKTDQQACITCYIT